MTDLEQLLTALLAERGEFDSSQIPPSQAEQRTLLRALMNTRLPEDLPPALLAMQDRELAAQLQEKGIVDAADIAPSPLYPRLALWQGDITRLRVGAIVNAANSEMLGCFQPLHNCIDNAIHSQAGIQLRNECSALMRAQGHAEPTGQAKITKGYNLPAKYVIHTVGPIVDGFKPTDEDRRLLKECYLNCLRVADEHRLSSIAFCCISTGVFRFPQAEAAEIAVSTVGDYLERHAASGLEKIIFDVFSDRDLHIYRRLLGYI